jgi:outer membrane phospholipase A
MLYKIYNEDETNKDIVNHLGYYSLGFFVSDLILLEDDHMDLEFKIFAGSKVYDFDKGGYQVGLVYNFDSDEFNPSIYLQRYEGFAESLDGYNIKRTEYRLGLLLAF